MSNKPKVKKVANECPSSRSGQHTWIYVRSEDNTRNEITFCDYCGAMKKG